MDKRLTRRERCAIGRHTPRDGDGRPVNPRDGGVMRACCRYCGAPIMRTQATRIWFQAGMLA